MSGSNPSTPIELTEFRSPDSRCLSPPNGSHTGPVAFVQSFPEPVPVGPLVALEHRLGRLPATQLAEHLERLIHQVRGELPPERMPRTAARTCFGSVSVSRTVPGSASRSARGWWRRTAAASGLRAGERVRAAPASASRSRWRARPAPLPPRPATGRWRRRTGGRSRAFPRSPIFRVIFISGYDRDETIAKTLKSGAVDYIGKPFSATELVARVQAELRSHGEPETFVLGELAVDYGQRRVCMSGRTVTLTATEFDLLRTLSMNAGRTVTNETLLRKVWARRGRPTPGRCGSKLHALPGLRQSITEGFRQLRNPPCFCPRTVQKSRTTPYLDWRLYDPGGHAEMTWWRIGRVPLGLRDRVRLGRKAWPSCA